MSPMSSKGFHEQNLNFQSSGNTQKIIKHLGLAEHSQKSAIVRPRNSIHKTVFHQMVLYALPIEAWLHSKTTKQLCLA